MKEEQIRDCLNRLITLDYKGQEDKIQALKTLLTPLFEALILCESKCWAGTPESQETFDLLRKYAKFGLGDQIRSHEVIETELKDKWKKLDEPPAP